MTVIRATHTCFDDALDFLEDLARNGFAPDELRKYAVVHGICLAPDGEPYAHAWVEREELEQVWQGGIVLGERVFHVMQSARFYAAFRVTKSTSYTIDEALAHNARTNHYGPWLDEYVELCRRDGDAPRVLMVVTPDGAAVAPPGSEHEVMREPHDQ